MWGGGKAVGVVSRLEASSEGKQPESVKQLPFGCKLRDK